MRLLCPFTLTPTLSAVLPWGFPVIGEALVIHRNYLPILALAMSAPALATFELKDPAAEMLEAEKAMSPAAIAERACFDFLVDSVDRPEVYRASVTWVRETAAALHGGAPVNQAALRQFCVDHPKSSLAEAAAVLGSRPAPAAD